MATALVEFEKAGYVSSHLEDGADIEIKNEQPQLKLDEHGLPLVPQPSDHKDDPLVRLNMCVSSNRSLVSDRVL
jgi:hypothetical protein